MAIDVVMPKLGLTMTEGLLVAWRVSDGDAVKRGQALFEIETDKATIEAEAPADGVIKILTQSGETVHVNARVGVILAPDEAAPAVDGTQLESSSSAEVTAAEPAKPAPSRNRRKRKLASPAAKRVARELGIDIQEVMGGGEGGRVEVADVRRFARNNPTQSQRLMTASRWARMAGAARPWRYQRRLHSKYSRLHSPPTSMPPGCWPCLKRSTHNMLINSASASHTMKSWCTSPREQYMSSRR